MGKIPLGVVGEVYEMIKINKTISFILILTLVIGLVGMLPVRPVYAAPSDYQPVTEVPSGYTPIYTVDELKAIFDHPDGNFILMNDIDLTESTAEGEGWKPIGTIYNPFTGIFDGNGYEIKGMRYFHSTIAGRLVTAGFFGYVDDGTILNLTLQATFKVQNTKYNSPVILGGLVGQSKKLNISNCSVNIEATVQGERVAIGGLVGTNSFMFDNYSLTGNGGLNESLVERVVLEDCRVNGSISANGVSNTLGGLVGYGRYLFAKDSINDAMLNGTYTNSDSYNCYGGIAGASRAYVIDGCINNGSIAGGKNVAGIVCDYGTLTTTNVGTEPKIITSSNNNGAMDGINTAGILYREDFTSYALSPFTIKNCANTGTVIGNVASGVLTCMNNGIVERCYNTGRIVGLESVSGIATKNVYGNISECYNVGILESQGHAGGIAIMNLDLIENCYNAGQVIGNKAAGLSLYNSSYALINNCYNVGGVGSSGITPAGIAGENDAIVANAYYYENTTTGVAENDFLGIDESEKFYLADLDEETTFEGFDFAADPIPLTSSRVKLAEATPGEGIWKMSSSSGLPVIAALPEIYITGVSVSKMPNKTTYLVNESVSTSGMILKVSYSNGKSVYITKGFVISPYSKSVGNRNIAVNYAGKKAVFPVSYTTFRGISYSYNSGKLYWSGVSNATSYKIYRATSATGPYSLIYTAKGTSRSYLNTGLTTGKNYYYKIRPMYGTKSGTASSYRVVKPIPSTPPSVAIAKVDNGITLTWGSVSGTSYYQVYRSTSLTGTYTYVKSTTSRTYTDTTLQHGTTYYYKVRSYHIEGGTRVYGIFSFPKKINWL